MALFIKYQFSNLFACGAPFYLTLIVSFQKKSLITPFSENNMVNTVK